MIGKAAPRAARSWAITRLLASRTGVPERPPVSFAWGRPATASRASVVLVAITPSMPWRSQRGGNHLDLRFFQIRRDLHEQRHPLAVALRQRLALVRHRAEQRVQRLVALQRAQVRGVGAGDVDRHVVGMRIHAVQADQVVVHGPLDRRCGVLADVEAQQHRRLAGVAPEARALHVGQEGVQPFVVEAQPVDERVALRQPEHARLRDCPAAPWA